MSGSEQESDSNPLVMTPLQTERLVIRPFLLEDRLSCERLYREVWESELPPGLLEWYARTPAALAHLYQPPYGDRAITLRQTGEIIGAAGLVPSLAPFSLLPGFSPTPETPRTARNSPEVGLFWCLRPAFRGQGYATEAGAALLAYGFDRLRLRRLIATTEAENQASIAVMRRLGMRIERNPYPEPFWLQIVGVREWATPTLEGTAQP